MIEFLVAAIVISIASFVTVYFFTPKLIKYLVHNNSTVLDYHKKDKTMVARPGGYSIIAGILVSEFILYLFIPNISILALMLTCFLAFTIGLIDDKKVMNGWFKPLALVGAALPILLLGAYDSNLTFPLFGEVKIPLLYMGLVVIIIPITGNTVNSIDVFNGVASGFMIIAGFCLSISLFILELFSSVPNYDIAIASLPLGFVALAFYKFHKLPSKIFPGDSGALTFGAMYGALAIIGEIEIVAAVALLPAIINSFLFLSSVKRVVEHRKLKAKPVEFTEDHKLKASDDKRAPITLVRIILSGGPLTEKEITYVIFKLAIFSGLLAIFTTFLMSVTL